MTTPIFIVSLPRSGSTLLQKMLAVSPLIASSAEPWIMLPFWSMRDPNAARSIYSHRASARAINDFIHEMHEGEERFVAAVRNFALTLYNAAARGKPFFLDKTPRYYLLVTLLQAAFPEAKIIVLTRNPLAVLASIGDTFYNGRFLWSDYWVDWIEGHRALGQLLLTESTNVRAVRYENLVTRPADELEQLCSWLSVPYIDEMVSGYRGERWGGGMGDPKGIKQYQSVSTSSLTKWHRFFASRFKRNIALKMLYRVDEKALEALGYPLCQLESELKAITTTKIIDIGGRYDNFINGLAYIGDYRYLQSRYRARVHNAHYAFGFFRSS